jgi:hypothetical protein
MKTAIEQAIERIEFMIHLIPNKDDKTEMVDTYKHCIKILKDFKEVEKEQIIHAKYVSHIDNFTHLKLMLSESKKFFNEHYKKK